MTTRADLDESQLSALNALRELTNNTADDDVAISILQSVDWDVQKAAELVFGPGYRYSEPVRKPSPPREEFEVDDSEQGALLGGGGVGPPPQQNQNNTVLAIISYPFSLLGTLIRFIFNFLRIPLPNIYIPLLSRRPFHSGLGRAGTRGRGTPERWIRELEEETGAVCLSKAAAVVSGVAGPSTSSSVTRRPGGGEEGKHLPDFSTFPTYDTFLKHLSKEAMIGCVVLVSEEHDDVAEFKRNTLTNTQLLNLFSTNDILVWGGDTRDTYAFTASLKLNVTSFPYVAFIALQPARSRHTSNSSSPTPTLSILSRHQGASACTPEVLASHLTETLLPRVQPYLARVKTSRETAAVQKSLEDQARQAERRLREEQDRAFAESARRDKERILAKMREEEERKRKEEEEALEQLRVVREAERLRKEEERKKRVRAGQREWFKANLPVEEGDVRVAIRLPSGTRVVRRFRGVDELAVLYAFVDTQLSSALTPEPVEEAYDSVEDAIESFMLEQGASAKEWWGFTLASAYPRREVPYTKGVLLGSIPDLGQVVVELVNGNGNGNGRNGNGNGGGALDTGKGKGKVKEVVQNEEEDEYETESDED